MIVDRIDPAGPVGSIFHYGLFTREGQKRDPRDDRSIALVAPAILEQGLEHALLTKFERDGPEIREQLFEGDGAPLRDLSAKLKLAFAHGIVGKETRSDISLIRQIRNTFAHSRLNIDFDTPEIADACSYLTLFKRWDSVNPGGLVSRDARDNFIAVSFEYTLWLFTIQHHPPHDPDDWQRGLLRS